MFVLSYMLVSGGLGCPSGLTPEHKLSTTSLCQAHGQQLS